MLINLTLTLSRFCAQLLFLIINSVDSYPTINMGASHISRPQAASEMHQNVNPAYIDQTLTGWEKNKRKKERKDSDFEWK